MSEHAKKTCMVKRFLITLVTLVFLSLPFGGPDASGFNWYSALKAGVKAYKAYTLTDEDVVAYVKQGINYLDSKNKVLSETNPYTVRLRKLTAGMKKVGTTPLNFKVYEVKKEVNAFACADGSIRVYTSIMDLMTDDELLGIIGHEIGHIGKQHSKKSIKNELMTGALRDMLSSYDNTLGALAESQLGSLGEMMINAKYSRKQETEADDYGYDFLKKNGKNPRNMAKALEKLQTLEQKYSGSGRYLLTLFSSHPETKKRIAHIQERCKKDGY